MNFEIDDLRSLAIRWESEGAALAASIVLESVCRACPEDWYAHVVLAESYNARGRFSFARDVLVKATVQCEESYKWIILARLADVAIRMGKLDAAENYFSDAFELGVDESWVYVLRANNLCVLERFDDAELIIESLYASKIPVEDEDEVVQILGRVAIGLGRYSEALEHYRRAKDLGGDPKVVEDVIRRFDHIDEVEALLHSAHLH